MSSIPKVQVIDRAVSLLEALRTGPKTLAELTRLTGLHKGTVYRILSSLQQANLVAKNPLNNEYSLGMGLVSLADAAIQHGGFLQPVLDGPTERLWRETLETVTVHAAVGNERVCVYERVSPHALRYSAGLGVRVPLNSGSAGKVLLAFLPDEEGARRLRALPMVKVTERTLTDREELERVLAEVRQQGYALSFGERAAGAAAVSVPVRLASGGRVDCIALSVLGPDSRLTRDVLVGLVPRLQEAAREIESAWQAYAGEQAVRGGGASWPSGS